MRHNRHSLAVWTTLAVLALASCGGNGGSSEENRYSGDLPGAQGDLGAIESPNVHPTYVNSEAPSGGSGNPTSVRFLLTDAPNPTIDSATVTISDVSVHHTGGASHSVLDEPVTLDLLDLQNGVTQLLGEVQLDPGKITMIRLVVEEAEVVSGDQSYPVEIPSGEIKLNRPIDLCDGGEIEIVIDFDAERSLRYNQGRDLFTMHPVVHITEVNQDCPPEESDEGEDDFVGPLGWVSIVLPPVTLEDFQSLTALIDDVQVHDQGIGQVSELTESYEADLLEAERQLADAATGEPLYTVLLPPIEVPAGELDQLRLFFQSITAVDAEGRTVVLALPGGDEGDGLKFFGSIEVCENALTVIQWDLALDAESLDFASGEDVTIHPVIQNPNVVITCEPIEGSDGGDQAIEPSDDDDSDDTEANDDDSSDDEEDDTEDNPSDDEDEDDTDDQD